jgi:hypothetical protein
MADEIVKFIKDGFFFNDLSINLIKESEQNWSIKIVYDKQKAPVVVSRRVSDPESKKEIEEIKFVLGISKETKVKHLILNTINSIIFIYTIQINQKEITDDCWEMLDSLESFLMKANDGILFTSSNEFFDQNLKKIYKL